MSRILKLVALSATFAVLAAFSGAAEARDCCKPAKIRCCKAPKIRCCQQTSCNQVTTTSTCTAAAENSGQTSQMASTNCCQARATCCQASSSRCITTQVSCSAPSNCNRGCAPACGGQGQGQGQGEVKEVPPPPKEEAAPAPKA